VVVSVHSVVAESVRVARDLATLLTTDSLGCTQIKFRSPSGWLIGSVCWLREMRGVPQRRLNHRFKADEHRFK